MNWITRSISGRITAFVTFFLILLTAIALIAILSLRTVVQDYRELADRFTNEVALEELNLDFKTQVQEWKNVLIRGSDDGQRSKYWDRFVKLENSIQQNARELLPKLESAEAKRLLQEFIDSHKAAGPKYRAGLRAYEAANYTATAGDQAVSGIDRRPTQTLKDATEAVAMEIEKQRDELNDAAGNVLAWSIPLVVLSALALLVGTMLFSRSQISKPFKMLIEDVEDFAAGDFTKEFRLERKDELGTMASKLGQFREFIRDVMQTLKQNAITLSNSANDINTASSDMAHSMTETQSHIEQTATAITQMSATVQEVSTSALSAAEAATDADEAANNGQSVMQASISTINQLVGEIQSSAEVIKKLEADTSSVGTVLDVIRGIAEQTNLLALNAAIEAARAGEQGRGFAVVADEVRNLAQRTQESTAEIQQILENVQTGAQNAVTAMTHSQESSSSCVEQSRTAEQSLESITEAVKRIHTMNTQIATAAEEQTVVAEDVSRNVNEIAEATGQISNKARGYATTANQLAEIAEQLTHLAQRIRL